MKIADNGVVTAHITNANVTNLTGTDYKKIDWNSDNYCVLIGFAAGIDEVDLHNYKLYEMNTFNNEHSRVISVEDPHHKSLNDIIEKNVRIKKR